ncbi:MAG: FtsX-like permease family protein [Myxococcales bacterium]|nr:FtsX-like permease family protein [Myxococcales bacterium]
MRLSSLSVRNVWRNRLRALLTVLGIAVAIVAFVLLRTVLSAWTVGAEASAKDRLGTRNKVTFVVPLPKRYIETIRQVPGVVDASYASWFGGKDPRHENEFFASMAVETKTLFSVFDELVVPPADRERWLNNRKGALVGDVLAKKLGWKVGDTVTLQGSIYPGDWQFQIEGIYSSTRKVVDRSSFFFHWDYLNDSLPEGSPQRDRIGWVTTRIRDPLQAGAISQAIDRAFDEQEIQTLTMSERAMNLSFLGMVSAVLKAIDLVSLVILFIMMLILGNTIAMSTRERTREFGVMRAIGFLPHHIALAVLIEAIVIGGLGGGLGLVLSYPLVERGMGRFIEENMGSFFPYFRISEGTAVAALVLALLLGLSAGLLPAYRAARLNVIDSLRRAG